MEITFVWSWFSFIVGVISALVGSFFLILGVAYRQWKKQNKATSEIEKWLNSKEK